MEISNPFQKKLTDMELLAKLEEESRVRRESERRWYAGLPTKVILSLCATIAVLTYLLSIAPQAAQRPATVPKEPVTSKQPTPPEAPASAAKPVSIQMKLSSRELFGYNSSELRVVAGSAQRTLDSCLTPQLSRIHVTGHADCIGSDDYNQRLSERRALAVKRYLTDKGVDAAVITTEGQGSTVAKADPICSGTVRSTAATVARLEPFRRVDVTCEYTKQVLHV